MAFELLVNLRNNDKVNLEHGLEWSEGLPKRGDVVDVHETSEPWGRLESLQVWLAQGNAKEDWVGQTLIVKVSGPYQAAAVKNVLTESAYRLLVEGEPGYVVPGSQAQPEAAPLQAMDVLVHTRAWRLRLSELPDTVQDFAEEHGYIEITFADMQRISEHKVARTRFDPNVPSGQGRRRPDFNSPLPREEPRNA